MIIVGCVLAVCYGYDFYWAGERETSFDLTIINDSIYEGDETFKLMILTGDVEDEVKTAIVTITDDEDSMYCIEYGWLCQWLRIVAKFIATQSDFTAN